MMSHLDHSNQDAKRETKGFPIELKLLLAVIVFGIIALTLKVTGVL